MRRDGLVDLKKGNILRNMKGIPRCPKEAPPSPRPWRLWPFSVNEQVKKEEIGEMLMK